MDGKIDLVKVPPKDKLDVGLEVLSHGDGVCDKDAVWGQLAECERQGEYVFEIILELERESEKEKVQEILVDTFLLSVGVAT